MRFLGQLTVRALRRYDATAAALRTSVAERDARLADLRAAAAEAESNLKVRRRSEWKHPALRVCANPLGRSQGYRGSL